MDLTREVETALIGADEVAKADYLRWCRQGNLATRARAYRLSETAWERIYPEPSMAEQCAFMAGYLLDCLIHDPAEDGYIHTGAASGYELAAWLKHLSTIPEAEPVIAEVTVGLANGYKASDAATRRRIETTALEHLLESPRLRRFFEPWQKDPILREGYEHALAWGLAHPGGSE